jgi:hypothetical protein
MADEPADVASDNEDTQWTPIDNLKGTGRARDSIMVPEEPET